MGYDEFSNVENILIGIIAGISIVCIVFLRYQVWKGNAPFAYSQPNNLILKKGTYELIICAMYILTPSIPDKYLFTGTMHLTDDENSNQIVESTNLAAFLSFLSQFSTAASELIVLQMSQELYIAATNPFASKKGSMNFNLTVIFPSLIISTLLICFGPQVYGLSNLGFCWIQDRFAYVFFFFYVWVIILYPFAFTRIYQANAILKKGLKSLNNKTKLTEKSIIAVWFYLIQWFVVLLLLFANMHNAPGGCFFGQWQFYCHTKIPESVINWLRPIAALSLATKGIFSYFLLWYINRHDLRERKTTLWAELFQKATRKDKSQTMLNEYLRQEILFYTSKGIRWAVRNFNNDIADRFSFENIRQSNQSDKHSLRISSRSASDLDSTINNETYEQQSELYDVGSFKLREASRTKLSNGIFDDLCNCTNKFTEKGPSFAYRKYILRIDEDVLNEQSQKAQFREKMTQAISYLGIQYFFANPRLKRKSQNSKSNSSFSSSKLSSVKNDDEDIKLDIDKIRETFSEVKSENSGGNNYDEHKEAFMTSTSLGRASFTANENIDIENTPNNKICKYPDLKNYDLKETLLKEQVKSTKAKSVNSYDAENNVEFEKPRSLPDKEVIFIDYEPEIFKEIRKSFGIDDNDYIESFSSITKEKFSEGKSGAFLYYSRNEKYIVKTTTRTELKNLLILLAKYRDYIKRYPHTFIVKFFSAHAVTMYDTTIYFFVMGNFFATKYSIDEYYDLKGSYIDRKANIPIIGSRGKCKFCHNYFVIGDTKGPSRKTYCYKRGMVQKHEVSVCLKDNDVFRKCILPASTASQVREQLKLDSNFLARSNLMDYSLILGVHHSKYHILEGNNEAKENPSDDDNKIDTLTDSPEKLVAQDLIKQDSLTLIRDLEEISEDSKRSSIAVNNPYGMRNDGAVVAALVEAPSFYYIGLVDILQGWTLEKKIENLYKQICGKDGNGISSVEPTLYCTRFQERVVDALIQGDADEKELKSIQELQALQSILEEEKYITTLEGGQRKRLLDPEGTIKEIWRKINGTSKKDKRSSTAK